MTPKESDTGSDGSDGVEPAGGMTFCPCRGPEVPDEWCTACGRKFECCPHMPTLKPPPPKPETQREGKPKPALSDAAFAILDRLTKPGAAPFPQALIDDLHAALAEHTRQVLLTAAERAIAAKTAGKRLTAEDLELIRGDVRTFGLNARQIDKLLDHIAAIEAELAETKDVLGLTEDVTEEHRASLITAKAKCAAIEAENARLREALGAAEHARDYFKYWMTRAGTDDGSAVGTFECPICGVGTPHRHDAPKGTP